MPVGALADRLASLQMLVGVVAFNVLDVLAPEDNRALGVLLTGYVFQGAFAIVRGSRTRRIAYAHILRPWLLHDVLLHLHIHHPVS